MLRVDLPCQTFSFCVIREPWVEVVMNSAALL
jgi:hypothetical protein